MSTVEVERITLAKVREGFILRTQQQGGSQLGGSRYVGADGTGQSPSSRFRTVERIESRQADQGRTGREYVLHFTDGTATEWRFGTTSHYRVADARAIPADRYSGRTSHPAEAQPVSLIKTSATDGEGPAVLATPVLPDHGIPHRTDAEINEALEGEPGEVDGDRCEPCKGYGLVRGVGKRAGERYKTLAGAHAAQEAGRAVDCPACHGLGLLGLIEAAQAMGKLEVITVSSCRARPAAATTSPGRW